MGLGLTRIDEAQQMVERAFDLAERLIQQLATVADQVGRQLQRDQYRSLVGAAVVGADGTAQVEFQLSPGTWWRIERIAVTCGAGAGFTLYQDSVDPQNLLDYQGSAQTNAWGPQNNLIVPEGRRLIARFFGAPVGANATVRIRVVEFAEGE